MGLVDVHSVGGRRFVEVRAEGLGHFDIHGVAGSRLAGWGFGGVGPVDDHGIGGKRLVGAGTGGRSLSCVCAGREGGEGLRTGDVDVDVHGVIGDRVLQLLIPHGGLGRGSCPRCGEGGVRVGARGWAEAPHLWGGEQALPLCPFGLRA